VTHVSAVICTRNRPELLQAAAASVLANTYPEFDLVVIDQSDNQRTAEIVRKLAEAHSNVRYVRCPTPGVSRGRNLGVATTTGELVAFTDDDCVVAPDWIERINAAFAGDPRADMLFGQVLRPSGTDDSDGILPTLEFEEYRHIGKPGRFRMFGMTANFAGRRRVFDVVGGFDEQLGPGGPLYSGEDFDFQYRAFLAGMTTALRPDVKVDHYGFRTLNEWGTTLHRYGLGDAAFYLKHVRCGDLLMLSLLVRRFGRVCIRELLEILHIRRKGSFAIYLRAWGEGARASLRFRVDRRNRLYRPLALFT
jgi:glycosyltransferase involved in cell wall biosynthesis